jgi:hypothetical protein
MVHRAKPVALQVRYVAGCVEGEYLAPAVEEHFVPVQQTVYDQTRLRRFVSIADSMFSVAETSRAEIKKANGLSMFVGDFRDAFQF